MTAPAWKATRLDREIRLSYGKSLPEAARRPGPVAVYGSNGRVGTHIESLVEGPGIIVGRKGSVGEIAFSESAFWPIDTTYYVENPKGHNWHFLRYKLLSLGLDELNSHSAVPGLNRESVYSIECEFPDLPEQVTIAAVLSTVERAMAIEAKLIATTRELKQVTMRQLFTRGLRNEPQKDSPVGPVPVSWPVGPLSQVCKSSAFGPRFSSAQYSGTGALVTLRTTDIADDGTIDYSRAPRADLNPDEWSEHLLKTEDCVVTRSGTCGIVAVFCGYELPVLPGAFLIRVRLNGEMRPDFFRYFGNSIAGREQMKLLAQGAIQKNISGTRLLTFLIPRPTLDEQDQIISIVRKVDRKIDVHERRHTALKELFETLLRELMTGRLSAADVRVTWPETAATVGSRTPKGL